MKHTTPCLIENSPLEAVAALADQRKRQALDRLMEKLEATPSEEKDEFETAMHTLIDADKAALEAKGR